MTTKIIATVVAVVLVGAGGYYVIQNNGQSSVQEQENSTDTSKLDTNDTSFAMNGEAAFRALFLSGQSLKCDVQYTPDEIEGTAVGTVYIAPEQFRADITMTGAMGSTDMSVIHTNTTGYAWGQTPVGQMAIKFDTDNDTKDAENSESFDMDENVQYNCQKWNVDTSVFQPPSNIEFIDLQAQMQSTIDANANINAMQCSACNQISDPSAKAQCLTAMNCN